MHLLTPINNHYDKPIVYDILIKGVKNKCMTNSLGEKYISRTGFISYVNQRLGLKKEYDNRIIKELKLFGLIKTPNKLTIIIN